MGDISAEVPVNSTDEIGQMALSFNGMIDNIRSLARSAEAIGKGNYDTPVNVRGPQDVLGIALTRMKENLKAARLRDNEQTRALQAEKAKLEQANERIRGADQGDAPPGEEQPAGGGQPACACRPAPFSDERCSRPSTRARAV